MEYFNDDERDLLKRIRTRKATLIAEHRKKKAKGKNQAHVARKHNTDGRIKTSRMREELGGMGVNAEAAIQRVRGRSVTRRGRKRQHPDDGDEDMGDGVARSKSRSRSRMDKPVMGKVHSSKSRSRSRGASLAYDPGRTKKDQGLKNADAKMKATIVGDKMQRKMQKLARKGEGDRHIPNLMPKHLFSGKRGIGKTDRR